MQHVIRGYACNGWGPARCDPPTIPSRRARRLLRRGNLSPNPGARPALPQTRRARAGAPAKHRARQRYSSRARPPLLRSWADASSGPTRPRACASPTLAASPGRRGGVRAGRIFGGRCQRRGVGDAARGRRRGGAHAATWLDAGSSARLAWLARRPRRATRPPAIHLCARTRVGRPPLARVTGGLALAIPLHALRPALQLRQQREPAGLSYQRARGRAGGPTEHRAGLAGDRPHEAARGGACGRGAGARGARC